MKVCKICVDFMHVNLIPEYTLYDRRYANGEIEEEEYRKKSQDI